jgi:hypothetical protein
MALLAYPAPSPGNRANAEKTANPAETGCMTNALK